MSKEKRFISQYKQSGMLQDCEVLVDRETGVNYLFVKSGYGAGLTPLLGRDGKPVITVVESLGRD